MGLDQSLHLEPFIKIPTQYEFWNATIRTCGEHETNNTDKFCSKCGKLIVEQTIQRKSFSWSEDLIGSEDFSHFFMDKDETTILFDNTFGIGFSTEEDELVVITSELIHDMIVEFETKHAKNIQKLEQKLGFKVKVEFGFLNEYR